ncbi:MAG: T9SS type A sorting domain-containing protein [Bacteroidetes bacterium]|nr:T9SS type A sorting domain-containing protein [Bacteroidota bacterium]
MQPDQNQLDRLELMDMLGRRVIAKKASGKTETLDISPLVTGNYLLRICFKDGQYLTKKLVRE